MWSSIFSLKNAKVSLYSLNSSYRTLARNYPVQLTHTIPTSLSPISQAPNLVFQNLSRQRRTQSRLSNNSKSAPKREVHYLPKNKKSSPKRTHGLKQEHGLLARRCTTTLHAYKNQQSGAKGRSRKAKRLGTHARNSLLLLRRRNRRSAQIISLCVTKGGKVGGRARLRRSDLGLRGRVSVVAEERPNKTKRRVNSRTSKLLP